MAVSLYAVEGGSCLPEVLEDLEMRSLELLEAYWATKAPKTSYLYRHYIDEWIKWLGDRETRSRIGKLWDKGREIFRSDASFLHATKDDAKQFQVWAGARKGQRSRDGRSDKVTKQTVVRKMAILRQHYDWLIEHHHTEINPFRIPYDRVPRKPSKRPTEGLTREQVKKLLAIADPSTFNGLRDRTAILLLFFTGVRRSELVNIRICDLKLDHPEQPHLYIPEQKSGEPGLVAIQSGVVEQIREYVTVRVQTYKASQLEPLFVRISGPLCKKHPTCSHRWVARMFKDSCRKAGLPDCFTPHSARATAITRLLEQNVSHREVQEFSRHHSIQMVEVYDKRRLEIRQNPGRLLNYWSDDEK